MRLYLTIVFSIASGFLCAQEKNYSFSPPLDIKEPGWNKVLCMKNGNTVLFHFEKDKRVVVKVFDSTRREIASQKDFYKVLNFEKPNFVTKALYDLNDEAVLFIDQELNSKHCLIRLRYNSHTGKLIDESLVAESKSVDKTMKFYIMKHRYDENYEILFCTDKHHQKESDIYIVFFNNKHQSLKEIQLPVDRKQYDDLKIAGAETHPNGVLVTAALTKTLVYAIGGSKGPINEKSSTDDHYLQFFYIPAESKNVKGSIVHLSTGVFPSGSHYTYNEFAQSLNLLLFSYKNIAYGSGYGYNGSVKRSLFFKIDEQDISSVGVNELRNIMANAFLQKQTDTTEIFNGSPVTMHTDANGLTTVISEGFNRNKSQESINGYSNDVYVQNIGITQVDDNGNELWGIVLPLSQYYNSFRSYPKYSSELMYARPVRKNKNFYLVYNDYNKGTSKN